MESLFLRFVGVAACVQMTQFDRIWPRLMPSPIGRLPSHPHNKTLSHIFATVEPKQLWMYNNHLTMYRHSPSPVAAKRRSILRLPQTPATQTQRNNNIVYFPIKTAFRMAFSRGVFVSFSFSVSVELREVP